MPSASLQQTIPSPVIDSNIYNQQHNFTDFKKYVTTDSFLSDQMADNLFLGSPEALEPAHLNSHNASPQPYPILSSPQDIYHEIVCECEPMEKSSYLIVWVFLILRVLLKKLIYIVPNSHVIFWKFFNKLYKKISLKKQHFFVQTKKKAKKGNL